MPTTHPVIAPSPEALQQAFNKGGTLASAPPLSRRADSDSFEISVDDYGYPIEPPLTWTVSAQLITPLDEALYLGWKSKGGTKQDKEAVGARLPRLAYQIKCEVSWRGTPAAGASAHPPRGISYRLRGKSNPGVKPTKISIITRDNSHLSLIFDLRDVEGGYMITEEMKEIYLDVGIDDDPITLSFIL